MKNNEFSDTQRSIIIGSLLGDGSITMPRCGKSAFVKKQCDAHYEYLQWHYNQFQNFNCSLHPGTTKVEDKIFKRHSFYIPCHPFFTELRTEWYPDGIKIIPSSITLDPLSIAIWFFDDGSNVPKARRATFATYCFSRKDIELLTDILCRKFNIECTINCKNVIVVKTNSYKKLIDLVSPFMLWPCFKHKLSYRESLSSPSCKQDLSKVLQWNTEGKTVEWIASKLSVSRASVYNQIRNHRSKNLSRILPLNNTSGIKGVCFDKSRNKWVAHTKFHGKTKNLGRFGSKEEAEQSILLFAKGSIPIHSA